MTIAGVAQIVIGATGSQLQIEIAKGTPFGVQPLVVTTPCGTVEDTISVVTDAPIVDEIVPVVAVLGQVLNIYGDHLEGASVTLGGMAQVLTVDSKKGLSFVVHPTTPTGAQTLEVATLGGIATKTVTVVGQPVITLVEPNPITAGNTLNIHGNHLIGAEVTIGGVDAIGVFAANTLVEAITSPDTPAGVQTVVLTTAAGEATAEVTVISPPKIDELSPDPAHPGQLLTITGANFVVPSVTIASIPHELFDITETQLKVVVLASVPLGNQPVTVTSNGGNATAFVKITIPPNIDSVLPDPLVIDEPFTISGDHLGPNPVVRIGGVVQLVTESSDTEITGKVLNSTPDGEHLLTVTTLDGEGIAGVVVIGPPNITGVDPDPVKVGETLTIFGTAMANATVSLGGTILEPITADDTTITVTVPADTPPGNQTIVVQTGAGLDTVQVTVLGLPPTISLVLPDPVLSGGTLTISGNNLLGATATLGGVGLTIIDNAIDSITAHVSPQTPTGLQPLAVTTSAGLAQTTVTVEDPPPTLPPVITFVAPSLAEVGAEVTITGQHLTGAIVVIAATEQTITSNTPTEIVFTVTDGTAVGDQTLTVFTVAGQAAVSFEVKGEPPVIGSALPDPVAIGQPLTITGAHLDSFTNATLGGVKQALFLTIQPTKLVFLVAPGTPTGASIALVITTPAGQASTLVGVDPAPFAAPEIFTVSPPSADPGADIEVFGDGLDGALWTIAGLPHTPEAGSNDFSVTLTISTDVPPGTQTVQAAEDGFVSTGTVFVNPQAPVDGQVFLSAVDATGGATLIGTNGTVEPLAGLDLTVDGTPVFATANGEGGFGVALTGVSGGQTVSLGQLIEGVASPAITRVLSGGDGPPTPHPFLIRVESAGDDAIVSGPPPAFGDPDNTVLAMAGAQVGFATAGDLYGAATITLTNGALDGPVTVFVGGPTPAAPASATTVTFATPFDPPLLASAVKDDEACLCGLKGTTDGEGLSVTIEDSGGDEIVPDELTWATGPDGAFAAWALLPKSAPNPPYVWRPDLGDAIPTVTFDAPAQELLSIEDVGLEPGDEGLTVTAAGLNEGVLFVVMSSDGQAAAQYADPTGAATVVLDGFPAVVRTFTVDLTTSNPTPCLTLDLLLE